MKNYELYDILLVEDNPHDAELTLRALKKHRIENPVHVVKDGEEALDFVFCRGAYADKDISRRPRAIFLDLKLPKLNGLEVLRAVKSDERTRTIPVVIITSSKEDPDIEAAYALGANSYVVKPIDFEAFFETAGKLGLYWLLVNKSPGG